MKTFLFYPINHYISYSHNLSYFLYRSSVIYLTYRVGKGYYSFDKYYKTFKRAYNHFLKRISEEWSYREGKHSVYCGRNEKYRIPCTYKGE